MKKTFPFTEAGKADARVIEAIKADVRRYVKRERRKPLPTGADLWTFSCAVGDSQSSAQPKTLTEVSRAIDEIAASGSPSVYIEVVASAGNHPPRQDRLPAS